MDNIRDRNLHITNLEHDHHSAVSTQFDEVPLPDNIEPILCTQFDDVEDHNIEHIINTHNEIVEPIIGMEFSSIDDAYQFYIKYGGQIGFNVRKKHQQKKKNGDISRVVFCCSKEGFRQVDKRTKPGSYTRPISRTGCKSDIVCLLGKNGKYKVVSFNGNHNHNLVRTPMKHILKVNRRISSAQKALAYDAERSGISIKATMELMSREVGGRENLGFLDKDYINYIHKERKSRIENGEARVLLQYFQKRQVESSSFFYALQLDEDNMITNIFWTDARSICDYRLFGDVICFDTTYRTNELGRPFAPFVGVNHHKQSVVFGAALLYDETVESFKWLFETFLGAMSKKQPQTILTDQSAAMAKAISEVFSETEHRLCVWHIFQNAAKNLSHVFQRSNQFVHEFSRCMYDYDYEDDWLLAWKQMLDTHNLKDNKWLTNLFELRVKWAMVYGRHTFTADMKSTQRSESMNSLLKKYLKPSHDILRFLEHYERVLADRRYNELIADFKMNQTTPVLFRNTDMLQHGAEIYTPEMFKLFQKEYVDILMCSLYKIDKCDDTSEYKVTFSGSSHYRSVKYEASTQRVTCSCMKFTFMGILCTHALKVLEKKNVNKIPSSYILKRWTKEARISNEFENEVLEKRSNCKESMAKRYTYLCRNACQISSLAAEHEELFEHTSQTFIQLLKYLEKKKKSILVDNNNDTNVEDSSLIEDKLIEARGVKRKATVGRPRNRLKDPLEKRRYKQNVKSKKASSSSNHIINLTQENMIEKDTQIASMSSSVDQQIISMNRKNNMSFTQLLEEASTFGHKNPTKEH